MKTAKSTDQRSKMHPLFRELVWGDLSSHPTRDKRSTAATRVLIRRAR